MTTLWDKAVAWLHKTLDVEVIWRPVPHTSLFEIMWDGFYPFTKPRLVDGEMQPGKPLKLPRILHHVIQHMIPSSALALLLAWIGLPGWVAGLLGAIAFGVVPHLIGVYVLRSYALDPRDWLADFWSSCVALSIMAVPSSMWIVSFGFWNVGYWTYVCWWAWP